MNNRLTQTCIDLLDIESVSRNEAALEAHIRAALPSSFSIAYDNDSCLYAMAPRQPDRELVVLAGHTDTVPIENNFPSRTEGNVIYARGASDMKSGLAVMLELARWIDEGEVDLAFDVGFVFFGREELPAKECALRPALDDKAFSDISLAVLLEPTDNAIEAGCVGNLNLRVTFTGTSAHSARPWLGDNAIHKAIVALNAFAQRKPESAIIDGLEFKEVASITQMSGGVALNVIPHRSEFLVNIRYAPSRTPEAARDQWVQYFKQLGADVDIIGLARSAPVALQHPLIQRLQDAGVTDTRAKQAWTNAADFAELGIPAVNFGPGDPVFAHKVDEQVSIAALEQSLLTFQKFLS